MMFQKNIGTQKDYAVVAIKSLFSKPSNPRRNVLHEENMWGFPMAVKRYILNKIAEDISASLSILINGSISQGIYPTIVIYKRKDSTTSYWTVIWHESCHRQRESCTVNKKMQREWSIQSSPLNWPWFLVKSPVIHMI